MVLATHFNENAARHEGRGVMELGYFAADTLGLTLYQIKDTLVAQEIHGMTLGPWKFDLPVDVRSDLLAGTGLGFWVTVAKIPLYVVVKEKSCWLFVLDPVHLKWLRDGHAIQSEVLKTRVLELKPAIKAVFNWRGHEWIHVEYDSDTGG